MDIAICDACVLIDFCFVDKNILKCITQYYDHVFVPDVIINEVSNLTEQEAKDVGLEIVSSVLNADEVKGLSFPDRVCLEYVKKYKCFCLTNDKLLRKHCIDVGGKVVWSLRLLELMVSAEMMDKKYAIDMAEKIYSINPCITKVILDNFKTRIGKI